MIIPAIKHDSITEHTWQMIKQYTFKPDETHIITNETLGIPAEHRAQGGSRKIPYAFDKFNPDILIYHASDWILDKYALEVIMSYMRDPLVISAGIRPWTRNGGSWHECLKDEPAHACVYVVAFKKEIMEYVKKLMQANFTGEPLNEACFYAVENGWEVRPAYVHAYPTGGH